MKTLTAFALFISFAMSTRAQTTTAAQAALLKDFSAMQRYSNYNYEDTSAGKDDSLTAASDRFLQGLLAYTSRYPISNATALKAKGLYVATSADGRLRIYSWDEEDGGTMHFFRNIYQYQSGGKLHSFTPLDDTNNVGDPRAFYTGIYQLETDGIMYYLATSTAMLSTKNSYQSIAAMRINGQLLMMDVPVIKTKSGLHSSLGFGYDFFSVTEPHEWPLRLIKYDAVTKTISMPVVLEDGKVTDKLIRYQFKGRYFEKLN